MRIALFVTCLADTLFPVVGRATVRLLERLGHEVEFPQAQTCCGQMHVNTGYVRDALPLVRRYVEVFERCDVMVAPSGSCVGSIRHQHPMVARRCGDEKLALRAEAVTSSSNEWKACTGRAPSTSSWSAHPHADRPGAPARISQNGHGCVRAEPAAGFRPCWFMSAPHRSRGRARPAPHPHHALMRAPPAKGATGS
jgi:Cysteine-rich domain